MYAYFHYLALMFIYMCTKYCGFLPSCMLNPNIILEFTQKGKWDFKNSRIDVNTCFGKELKEPKLIEKYYTLNTAIIATVKYESASIAPLLQCPKHHDESI